MTENNDHSQNQQGSLIQKVIIVGFVGGIMWSIVGYVCYYFSFAKIEPNIILEPFTVGTWRESWIGIIISILVYGLISIGAALVYYLVLKKFKSMWIGIGYGVILCLVVFVILNPIFPSMKPVLKLDFNTMITSICVYALYGLFVGYSISYEHNELMNFQEKPM